MLLNTAIWSFYDASSLYISINVLFNFDAISSNANQNWPMLLIKLIFSISFYFAFQKLFEKPKLNSVVLMWSVIMPGSLVRLLKEPAGKKFLLLTWYIKLVFIRIANRAVSPVDVVKKHTVIAVVNDMKKNCLRHL